MFRRNIMLTPVEIKQKTFKSGIGYSKEEVDSFLEEVASAYEELYKQNVEYKDKINMLNEGLQHYKTIEASLQKALILAEKTADDTIKSAEEKAKNIEQDAINRANSMNLEAKMELNNIHNQTITLVQQYAKYKAQFNQFIATQQEILNNRSFELNFSNLEAFNSSLDSTEEGKAMREEIQQEILKANQSQLGGSSVEAIAAAQEPVQNAIEADTSSSEEPKLSSEDSSSDKGLAGFDFVS